MMTDTAGEIKILGLGLNHGESVLEYCPFCKVTHEKTFSITRDGAALLFNCYRASCGESGLIYTSGSPKKLDRKQFNSKTFTKPVRELDEVERLDLESRWGTHNTDWKITTDEDWLVIPTKDACGYVWGTYIKRVPWKSFTGKKTILYPETEFPAHLHFPYPLTSTSIVLVEDPISANRITNGVSLLGTHVKKETLIYLKRLGIEHIDFALDFDALKKAVKAAREAGTMFSTRVLVWDSKLDPKDMDPLEFRAVFRRQEERELIEREKLAESIREETATPVTESALKSMEDALAPKPRKKQPPPNDQWCVGCSPDNCQGGCDA